LHLVLFVLLTIGSIFLDDENKKILVEAYRLLMYRGTLLLDLPDRDYVLQNFKPFSFHKVDEDITVSRERELGNDNIYSRERVISAQKGCLRDSTYCTRLYSPEKIFDLLHSVGLSSITCRKGFMSRAEEGDYGCMTNRMIVIAKKDKKKSF